MHGFGFEEDPVELQPASVEARRLFGPQASEGAQIFVGHPSALAEWRADYRIEFRLEPARADPDNEPPAREDVDSGQHLGGEHGWAVRHDHHRQHKADAAGLRGDEGRRRQLLVPAFGTFSEEFAPFGIGVAQHPQVRQHDVVGQCQVIVAQCLAKLCDPGHDLGRRHWTTDRQVEPYLHLRLVTRLGDER